MRGVEESWKGTNQLLCCPFNVSLYCGELGENQAGFKQAVKQHKTVYGQANGAETACTVCF